jgi:hypothetical protein
MYNGHGGTRRFFLIAYCCIPLQLPRVYVYQPKVHVVIMRPRKENPWLVGMAEHKTRSLFFQFVLLPSIFVSLTSTNARRLCPTKVIITNIRVNKMARREVGL